MRRGKEKIPSRNQNQKFRITHKNQKSYILLVVYDEVVILRRAFILFFIPFLFTASGGGGRSEDGLGR